jgi:cephalosporin hydroxylase
LACGQLGIRIARTTIASGSVVAKIRKAATAKRNGQSLSNPKNGSTEKPSRLPALRPSHDMSVRVGAAVATAQLGSVKQFVAIPYCFVAINSYERDMWKPPFRVKRCASAKYKFLVRGKVEGKWKRRYFVTETEAIAFAECQNAKAQGRNGDGSPPQDASTPRPAELTRTTQSTPTTDFAKLVTPTFLGPRIQRYLGDSWCMHLPFAYDLMRELAPKVFVELGVKQGESYFSFCQSAAENKINVRCYGVDSWRGDIQTGNLDPEMQHEVAEYNWQYSSFSELKTMLFAEALGDFPDATIDLLHIDGTHTYDEVKADFESWLPKLSPNGIILFHDVMMRDRGFGVWKVWEEIAREDNSFLFEFGFGLGVWKKQPVAPSDSFFVRRLLGANKTERSDINEYYANAAAALALWQRLRRQSSAENEVARFKTDAAERTQITQLQRDLEERSRQVEHFQRETEQQSHLLERLRSQVEASNDQLLDARWEALTLRGILLRKTDSAKTPSSRVLELENRVETTTSERDQLRAMLVSLQNDLERERLTEQARQGELHATQNELKATQNELKATQDQLKTMAKDLRSEQKQMDRLRARISGKLILPFGKSQRKLQQLTASRRADE